MMNRIIVLVAVAMIAGAALIGCGRGNKANEVKITGSDTMLNLNKAWAEAFHKKNPQVDINVNGGGSGVGLNALIEKTTDVAAASRKIEDKEKENCDKAGVKPVETQVAWDGLSIVVNKDFPADEISYEQLKAIYGDKNVTNWKQVPGFENIDMELRVFSRDTSSGTYVYFQEEILGKKNDYRQDETLKRMQGNAQILDQVISTKGSIGYVGMGYVAERKGEMKVLKVRKKAGDTAYETSAKEYPLCRPLYFYTNGDAAGAVKEFLEFCKSEEGQKIVKDQGFIPLSER
jgi:phosphate transport system substrate-binding protein